MLASETSRSDRLSCVYPSCGETSISVELFHAHLSRCRRKWRGPMFVCPYNGSHILPTPEEAYHSYTCTDRSNYADFAGKNDEIVRETEKTMDEAKFKFQRVHQQRGVGNHFAKWNVGPRLQRSLEKLSMTDEEKSKKEEFDSPSTNGLGNAFYPRRGGGTYQFRGRGRGNHSFHGSQAAQNQSYANHRQNALPTFAQASAKSESDQSMTGTSFGFRPWTSSTKSAFYNRRHLRTASGSSGSS